MSVSAAKKKDGSGKESKESCVTEEHLSLNATSSEEEDKEMSGKLDWDKSLIWLVLSCFSWGYLTTQIIGGRLAEMFGFKKSYGLGLFIPALLMLLHPVAARTDARLFIALRVLVGIGSAKRQRPVRGCELHPVLRRHHRGTGHLL